MDEATIPLGRYYATATLPRPIRRALGRLGLRLRLASCLRGLGTTILVMALCAAMGMAADLAWVLPQVTRWAIWGVWLAIGGLIFLLTILRPLFRRFGAFDLAAVAERGHPELGERLTGAVALLGNGRAPHGSPTLIAALAEEAVAEARTVKPAGAVSWSRAGRRFAGALLVLGLIASPASRWPDSYGTLARRFLMPWADIDRIGRFVVTVAPGDKVLAVGSDLTVSAGIRPLLGIGPTPESAWLEWTADGDAGPQRIAMPPASGPESSDPSARRFAFTLPKLGRSFAYRVVSGEATSRTAPDHDSRTAFRHIHRGQGRAAGLYQAPDHDRPQPGPDRRPGGQPDHARHHAQPARPLHRGRMAEAGRNEARARRGSLGRRRSERLGDTRRRGIRPVHAGPSRRA